MPGNPIKPKISVALKTALGTAQVQTSVTTRPELPAGAIIRPPITLAQPALGNLFSAGRRGASVVRPDDLLALRIELVNLQIQPGTPATVVKTAKGASRIVLHFPPQNITEQVFYEKPPAGVNEKHDETYLKNLGKPAPQSGTVFDGEMHAPLRARVAGESRVAFEVPEGFSAPYTLQGVLEACARLPLSVAANALPPQAPQRRPQWLDVVLAPAKVAQAMSVVGSARLAQSVVRTQQLALAGGGQGSALAARLTQIGAGAVIDITKPPVLTLPRLKPSPGMPAAEQTALELPWRLILSPHQDERFVHAGAPVTSALTRRTEVWHSRLVGPAVDGRTIEPPRADAGRTVRAVWALTGEGSDKSKPMKSKFPTTIDLPPSDQSGGPFLTTLSDFDRVQIAHLSSNFSAGNYDPAAIDTRLLMLSALGGWLDSRGEWDPPGLAVEEWSHRAAMGRDHWVRVVYKGFLYPFGHRVALIKVSERKFHNGLSNTPKMDGNPAFLRQRMFIVVRERERDYVDPQLQDKQGNSFQRQMPFNKVRILTTVTPDLDPPTSTAAKIGSQGQSMFWPCVGGAPFAFRCVGTDIDGRRVGFELPMVFMDNSRASPRSLKAGKLVPDFPTAEGYAAQARAAWDALPQWRAAQLKGQRVALAPSARPGDTAVDAVQITFSAQIEAKGNGLRSYSDDLQRPVFYPCVTEVQARIPALSQLTGAGASNTLTWNAHYLKQAFGGNAGEVFADVAAGGAQLDFSSQGDRSGGFVMPNMAPRALSRLAGPVSVDPAKFVSGANIGGADLFPGGIGGLPLPLLFGCIPLGEVIQAVASLGGAPQKIPRFASEASTRLEGFIGALVRALECVRNLGADSSSLARAAVGVVQGMQGDLLAQAKALVPSQAAQFVQALTQLGTALDGVRAKLASVAPGTAIDSIGAALDGLPGLIDTVLPKVQQVAAAAQGAPLPSGLKQSALGMAQQATALLQDLKTLSQLIPQGKALHDALAAIVGDADGLGALLSQPAQLAARLQAVGQAIDAIRATLAGFRLLDGAPRKLMLDALGAVSGVLDTAGDLLKLLDNLLGEELVIRFDWAPEIKSWGFDPAKPLFRANDPHGFKVAVEARVKKDGSESPRISVLCGLKAFDLVLINPAAFLELNFEKIEFSVDSAAKMNVDVQLSDIKFVGPLSFVETLRDLIPLDGFSDPPYLDISPKGIEAGFSLALPNVAVGVLSLTNLGLSAAVTVPFIGQPLSARFNFCTREQPFNLTVSLFGGGGFFGVTVDPHGVQILEAAFEFGASVSVDFGVASGGVHVMAGIYFRMEQDAATLAGYFRLGGHVSVLGLISASLELYLELRYEFQTGKAVGTAQLTIEVEVFLFSASVTIRCERKFAGSNGDPSLRDLLGLDPALPLADELALIDTRAGQETEYAWREYCDAFAA